LTAFFRLTISLAILWTKIGSGWFLLAELHRCQSCQL
jgi:hypothetical protein